MDNFVKGYYAYLDYFRESFGGSITPPTYNEWLINLNENQDSNQDSNLRVSEQDSLQQYSQQSNQQQKTDDDDKASHSSYSLSVQPRKANKRQRWTHEQTTVLIQKWKENFEVVESSRQYGAWLKIKVAVDAAGPDKSVRQCKDKMRNLKDVYKQARDNNKLTGVSPTYPPFYDDLDEVLGTRDCVSMPNVQEVGTATFGALELELTEENEDNGELSPSLISDSGK